MGANGIGQLAQKASEVGIGSRFFLDGLAGVDHSTVVPAAEVEADGLVGGIGEECFGEEHGDMPWNGDLLSSGLGDEEIRSDLEMVGDRMLDEVYGRLRSGLGGRLRTVQDICSEFFGDRLMGEGRMSDKSGKASL